MHTPYNKEMINLNTASAAVQERVSEVNSLQGAIDKVKSLQIIELVEHCKTVVTINTNNLNERVHELKADLEGSFYELYPLMGRKIGSL